MRCAQQIPLATESRFVLCQHRHQTNNITNRVNRFWLLWHFVERPKKQFCHFKLWANSIAQHSRHGRRRRRNWLTKRLLSPSNRMQFLRRHCWCQWIQFWVISDVNMKIFRFPRSSYDAGTTMEDAGSLLFLEWTTHIRNNQLFKRNEAMLCWHFLRNVLLHCVSGFSDVNSTAKCKEYRCLDFSYIVCFRRFRNCSSHKVSSLRVSRCEKFRAFSSLKPRWRCVRSSVEHSFALVCSI